MSRVHRKKVIAICADVEGSDDNAGEIKHIMNMIKRKVEKVCVCVYEHA